ncbi:MAG: hypothetical protein UIM24_00995 [Clostridia bacterium]|nr:hypothetical protein [Clostridia bacterium]
MKIFNKKILTIIMSIICILVVASTWLFNLGWLRLFMSAVVIPHSVIFVFMNLYSAKYFDKSKKVKMLNVIFVFTFLIAYVFMPDSSDINSYGFWGLIHDEQILNVAELISTIGFIVHITTFVIQLLQTEKIKKISKENK